MMPKIAHFYWGAEKLSYLRYLTIYSFHKYNPEWEIRYYTPKKLSTNISWVSNEQKIPFIGEDHSYRLKDISINYSQVDMEESLPEVHKSDILRLKLLSTDGGLWSDMDILYRRKINIDLNNDTCVCINSSYGHSIGFLLSSINNGVFRELYKEALYRLGGIRYQNFGVEVYNSRFPSVNSIKEFSANRVYNIPMNTVYPMEDNNIQKIFIGGAPILTEETIGLHWFGGHPMSAQVENDFNNVWQEGYKFERPATLIGQVLQEILC